MIKLLLRLFIKDAAHTRDTRVRTAHVMLSAVLGICCNTALFLLKFFIGMAAKSVAITSDAWNNLSDMSTSVISAIGVRMSRQRPDHTHPFGHGRIEYVSSLIVAFMICMVGLEQLRTAVEKLPHPDALQLSPIAWTLLVASVLVKLWMFSYNRYLARRVDSTVLAATSADSLSDVTATTAVILASVLSQYVFPTCPFSIDGAMGIVVSLLILRSGWGVARDTINRLLGTSPDPQTVEEITKMVQSGRDIVGMHDLVIHDYGPGRCFATVHAEVPANGDLVALHTEIDRIETQVLEQTGTELVIHMDPVRVGDRDTDALKARVSQMLVAANPLYSMHDFQTIDADGEIQISFDMVVPAQEKAEKTAEHVAQISRQIEELNEKYVAVIRIDADVGQPQAWEKLQTSASAMQPSSQPKSTAQTDQTTKVTIQQDVPANSDNGTKEQSKDPDTNADESGEQQKDAGEETSPRQ